MEKRLLTAILLSIGILFGWQFFMKAYYPPKPAAQLAKNPETAAPTAVPAEGPAATTPAPKPTPPGPTVPAAAPTDSEPERLLTVQTTHWTAKFSNRGAVPVSWVLTAGPDDKPIQAADGTALELIPEVGVQGIGAPLRVSVPGDDDTATRLNTSTYRVELRDASGVAVPVTADQPIIIADEQTMDLAFTLVDAASGQTFTKRFRIVGGLFDLGIMVEGTPVPPPMGIVVGPRIGDQTIRTEGTYAYSPPLAAVAGEDGKATYVHGGEVVDGGSMTVESIARWAGITDNYFAMAVAAPNEARSAAVVSNVKLRYDEKDEKNHDFLSVTMPISNGKPMRLFVGPKDPDLIEAVNERAKAEIGAAIDFSELINYGWFGFLVRPLIPVIDSTLQFTNRFTGNYGWSIIVVTALFNLLFFPLRYKSSVSMKRAAKLQPRMKELQEKMKKVKPTDPAFKELQAEQFALMKEGNPLGGCLPLLVQFPFFWAFFVYFTTSFVVRRQPWIGWVQDLTAPDPHYVLPVLMCAAQIGSMLVMPMPNSDDPVMKMQRRLMTWVMPIVFTYFFFVAAPSGLMLYWMTLNLAGIGIQFAINKMMPPDVKDVPAPAAVGSGKKAKKGGSQELVGSEK
ncbi:MAG: membrane protein insertase YidC [Blastocatellia bacterium]|nr:membrane protein insertase YidC [Blastocatellia bacterium]